MAVDYATLKKGGFMRQKQKNNFSLRIRVVGGTLTAKQLAVVSEVAEIYGKGYVHLTSRQGVEIPFIKLEQIDEVKRRTGKRWRCSGCLRTACPYRNSVSGRCGLSERMYRYLRAGTGAGCEIFWSRSAA